MAKKEVMLQAIKTKEPADKNTTRLKKLQPKGFRPNPKNPDGSPAIPPAGLISADAPSDVNPADEIQFEEKLKSLQSTGSLLAKVRTRANCATSQGQQCNLSGPAMQPLLHLTQIVLTACTLDV